MSKLFTCAASIVILSLWGAVSPVARADASTPAEYLPSDVLFYAETTKTKQLVDVALEHDLVRRVRSLDQVQAAMQQQGFREFQSVVAIVESQMGLSWREIVGRSTGGGVVLAVDSKTQTAAALARSTDGATHAKLIATLANLAALDAKHKGRPDPIQTSDYRGQKIYELDHARIAVVADWWVAANDSHWGNQIVDRLLDKPPGSLADNAQFVQARKSAGPSTAAWAYVNTAALRDRGLAEALWKGEAENPLAEMLFGGILETLQKTPYVAAAFDAGDRRLRLTATTPMDRTRIGDLREHYFGPQGMGAAPPRVAPHDSILSLSAYRDASAMWLRAGDLFDEPMNEELAKAESGLSTLFAGKDFGADILGALQPAVQLVVARQEFPPDRPAPAIKFPAFGLAADLKDPARMQPELRRIFQSVVGFLNIVGATNGQPQLELGAESSAGVQLITSSFLPDPPTEDRSELKIHHNFSPTVGFAGSRFVVASTKELASLLATAPAIPRSAADPQRVVNVDGSLELSALQKTLADNREHLVAQNMLSDGSTREEAEKKIDALLRVAGWMDRLLVSLDTTNEELRLAFDLELKPSN